MNRLKSILTSKDFKSIFLRDLPLIVTSLIIIVISLTVSWLGDDIDYMFRIKSAIWDSWGFLSSPAAFFESQCNHYLHVNGRIVAHALVQLYCGVFGQTAFAISNGVVWFIFLHLIFKGVDINYNRHLLESDNNLTLHLTVSSSLTVASLALFSFITKMMPTTQIGYIWMFTLILLWMRLYYSNCCGRYGGIVLLTLFGVIAGNAQEALSLGVCIILLSTIAKRRKEIFESPRSAMRLIFPAIGFAAGVAIDCFCPATLDRATSYADEITLGDSLLFAAVAFRALWLMILIIGYYAVSRRLSLEKFLKENFSVWLAILFLILFNLTIGIKSNRQLFGIELFSILLTLRALPGKTLPRIILLPLTAVVVLVYSFQINSAIKIRKEFKEIMTEYRESPNGIIMHSRMRASDNPLTREFRLYEELTGQFNNDVRHSMMKLFCHSFGTSKALQFAPSFIATDTTSRKIDSRQVRDTVVNFAEGYYSIITNAKSPNIVVCTRNQITGSETIDTLTNPRPSARMKMRESDKIWYFFEILPDRPFEKVVRINKIFVNSQSEHPETEK